MAEIRAMSAPVRLLVVEDDPGLRAAITEVLNDAPDVELIHIYPSTEALLEQVPSPCPDVAILDINLPGLDGVECLRRFSERCPSAQFLMYTVNDASEKVFEALKAGASGYVLKHGTPDELVAAIKDLHAGGAPMSASIARRVVDHFKPREKRNDLADRGLTPREQEILGKLAEGYQYKEIGDRLFISTSTVRNHVHRIYEKLHVDNRTEALNRVFGR